MSTPVVTVLPPPGLVAWAFPALADAHAALAREHGEARVLDLQREPLPAVTAEAFAGARVRIPAGRCGDALVGLLRAHHGVLEVERSGPFGLEALASAPPGLAACALPLPAAGDAVPPLTLDAAVERGGPHALLLRGARGLEAAERVLESLRGGTRAVYWLEDATRGEPGSPRTARLDPWAMGLLPGERYPAALRRRVHALVRALVPAAIGRFLELENAALAGVDLVGHALLGRGRRLTARARGVREGRTAGTPWIFAVSGLDGSGKSTHVAALVRHLTARGLRARAFKMYRHGVFHDTVTELTRRSAGGRDLHLWRAQRVIKGFDSLAYLEAVVRPALAELDALVFDRWLDTHHCAGARRFGHDPFTRELLDAYPAVDRLFLLDAEADVAIARLAERSERTVDENPRMLAAFARGMRDLARRSGAVVLDASRPFEENAAAIRREVDALLDRREDGEG